MQAALIFHLLVLLAVPMERPWPPSSFWGTLLPVRSMEGPSLSTAVPLFGPSKTIRGIAFAVLGTSGAASLFGLGWKIGSLVGTVDMASDLASSFLKRRMGLAPSSRAIGLDQIPESLFPLLACRFLLPLTILDIGVAAILFIVGALVLSRILFKLRLRDRPY